MVATADPNPVVHGKGIARLRAAGVEVSSGVLQEPARRLNDGFAKFITTVAAIRHHEGCGYARRSHRAGKTLSPPHLIGSAGEEARAEVHRMRHAADALIAGVGTILADDPLLTDRSHLPRRRPLLRIVLDSTLRTPLDSQLVKTADQDVLIFFSDASDTAQKDLEAAAFACSRLRIDGSHLAFAGK